jgi:hypothetical protein
MWRTGGNYFQGKPAKSLCVPEHSISQKELANKRSGSWLVVLGY